MREIHCMIFRRLILVAIAGLAHGTPLAWGSVSESQSAEDAPVRACSAQDIDAWTGWSRVSSTVAGAIYFTNRSTEPCVLQGHPDVELVDSHGEIVRLHRFGWGTPGYSGEAIVIAGGQQAQARIWWYPSWCRPEVAVALRVGLPDGSELDAPARDAIAPNCGVQSFEFSSTALLVGTFESGPTPPVSPTTFVMDCFEIVPPNVYLVQLNMPAALVGEAGVPDVERLAQELSAEYDLPEIIVSTYGLFGGFSAEIPPESVDAVRADPRVTQVSPRQPTRYTSATLPPMARGVTRVEVRGEGYGEVRPIECPSG